MTTFIIIALGCLIAFLWTCKLLWNSWIFWAVALAVTVLMFPITSGMSAVGFLAMAVIRIFIIRMIIVK